MISRVGIFAGLIGAVSSGALFLGCGVADSPTGGGGDVPAAAGVGGSSGMTGVGGAKTTTSSASGAQVTTTTATGSGSGPVTTTTASATAAQATSTTAGGSGGAQAATASGSGGAQATTASGSGGGLVTTATSSTGAGGAPCAGGLMACAGGCVDTATDEANCGVCGKACAANQTCAAGLCAGAPPATACVPMGQTPPGTLLENLIRGVVAVKVATGVFVSWRMFGYEPNAVAYNVYRDGVKINTAPIADSTNYSDAGGATGSKYQVRAILGGVEQSASETASVWGQGYLEVPLQVPPGGTTPDNVAYTYSANDASVGDVDGDGQYEIILKWDPSNSHDNSQAGYTGNVLLDAYKLDGTRLWRINLGRNIRAGAHYTQFMVYDLDGDGRAEVACKTAPGTVDGAGKNVIMGTDNPQADYRNGTGYVLSGPEYLTIFSGETGAELTTTAFVPPRGTVSAWGDAYGNRVDRFLAGIAYLDGKLPSLIMSRGYYTRTVISAWNWRNKQLTKVWTLDAANGTAFAGQGDHSLSVADIDGDGKQEIIYGAMAVDDDGKGLWSTGFGHGDALHVGDLDPSHPGLEIFNIQERVDQEGAHYNDAKTGKVIWAKPTTDPGSDNEGPGRGVADDIYAGNPGPEMWVAGGGIPGLFDTTGKSIGRNPGSCNFLVWWDADPVRELLDKNHIDKYGLTADTRLLTATGCSENNGTKSTPALSADLFGDWREEVMWRTTDSTKLRIFTTTIPTTRRIRTLMHDAQYRVAVAWQNTAYNQPPHPSFFIGDKMAEPPVPNVSVPCLP